MRKNVIRSQRGTIDGNMNPNWHNQCEYEPKGGKWRVIRIQRGTIDLGASIWHVFPSFSCSSKMNQRRISCEPWLRLQRAHLGKLCWNFNEHVQGLHQRRAVEDPNLCFLHLLFRDSQVSGVVQLFNLSPSNLPALLPCCYCHVAACVAWRVL